MATIGGDRDKLLKQFLENGRRKRKNQKPSVSYKPPKQGVPRQYKPPKQGY